MLREWHQMHSVIGWLPQGSLRVTDPQLQLAANTVAAENRELHTQLEVQTAALCD